LRLAVVSPFVDRRHGSERALAELLERLARDYHCAIHLYAQRADDLPLDASKPPHSSASGRIVWHKVPSIPGPHLVKFVGWLFANGFLRWWHRVFRRLSFDLILSPGINCLNADVIIVHAVFRRLQELAREAGSSGARSAGTRSSDFFRNLHRRAYYGLLTALERRLYSDRSTALAAVSQRTADLLDQYFHRGDVRVIPNGVDTREFSAPARAARRDAARWRFGLRETDFVLLLIGNDWRVKGLPVILQAMAQLLALPLHLLVVGDDAIAPFRESAKSLGVLDRCHWEAPRPDVITFYAAADIYVSPTLEDSFGLPVAEAMACGLPVITSTFAGVSGLIHNTVDGFVLPEPEDTLTLARIVERLYRDTEFRRNIGEAASRTAQHWTWDRSAAEAWQLLQTLAKTKTQQDHRRSDSAQ
jgi:glycosyltransferase involved in cell wall biosynthesis